MRTLTERVRGGQLTETGRLAGAGGLVTIRADTAEEAITFAAIVLQRLPATSRIAALDVTRCASTVAFCEEFARTVVSLYLGGREWLDYPQDQWPDDVRDGLLQLGDLTGGGLIQAVTTQRPLDSDSAVKLFAAAVDGLTRLAASGTRTLIALLGADELVSTGVGRGPLDGVDELLWTFRGRLQHAIEEPGVLLAGSDIAGELTANERAAFFGWGTTITLGVPARLEEEVAEILAEDGFEQTIAARWATEVVERSEGSLPTAERLTTLTVAESHAGAPAAVAVARAWRRLRELTHASHRQIARDLRSLHRLALPVVLAIAQDQPPYGVDRFSSGPNKALTRLHAAGLVVQHAPRSLASDRSPVRVVAARKPRHQSPGAWPTHTLGPATGGESLSRCRRLVVEPCEKRSSLKRCCTASRRRDREGHSGRRRHDHRQRRSGRLSLMGASDPR